MALSGEDAGFIPVISAANRVIALAAQPRSVQTEVLLPAGEREENLQRIEDGVRDAAGSLGILVTGGETQVLPALSSPVVTAAAAGDPWNETGKRGIGRDIVAAGWAGLCAAYLLCTKRESELPARFPASFVRAGREMRGFLSCQKMGSIYRAHVRKTQCSPCMTAASKGGVFAALWFLSKRTGLGFDVELKKIPILQETIEITDFFDISPYQSQSEGMMLFVTPDGDALVRELEDGGVRAECIGQLVDGKGKWVRNGEETRSLEKPAPDPVVGLV